MCSKGAGFVSLLFVFKEGLKKRQGKKNKKTKRKKINKKKARVGGLILEKAVNWILTEVWPQSGDVNGKSF